MLQIDHVMIIKLIRTFKDEKRMYFLMEFVRGKDLFHALTELKTLREDAAQFYAACIVLMLEYLHDRKIVHRDLKPENIIIDDEGYPKLIDFGGAKIVEGRTYSRLGTPYYMAPEIILGEGYGFTVDFWSLGIMIYEFLVGQCPFGANENDAYGIYKSILDHNLLFPENI